MEIRKLDKFRVPTIDTKEERVSVALSGSSILGIATGDTRAGDIISISCDGKFMVSGC